MKPCPVCESNRSVLERLINSIELLRCGSCGFVYADVPDERILAVNSRYSDQAQRLYDLHQTFLDDLWFQRIARRFNGRLGPGRVLDVGCGNGRLLRHFSEVGWDCWGVDTSPWSIEYAQLYRFKLVQGTIESVADQLGQFDLVVSSSTLEHIAQPVPHVTAISHLVRQGGYAYFCGMPNYASMAIRLGMSNFLYNRPPAHVNYFTPGTIRRVFACSGIPPDRLSIRTYGVPEWYRLYHFLTELKRRRSYGNRKPSAQAPGRSRRIAPQRRVGQTKRLSATIALGLFYHIGRVGFAGDKLEVTIRN